MTLNTDNNISVLANVKTICGESKIIYFTYLLHIAHTILTKSPIYGIWLDGKTRFKYFHCFILELADSTTHLIWKKEAKHKMREGVFVKEQLCHNKSCYPISKSRSFKGQGKKSKLLILMMSSVDVRGKL